MSQIKSDRDQGVWLRSMDRSINILRKDMDRISREVDEIKMDLLNNSFTKKAKFGNNIVTSWEQMEQEFKKSDETKRQILGLPPLVDTDKIEP